MFRSKKNSKTDAYGSDSDSFVMIRSYSSSPTCCWSGGNLSNLAFSDTTVAAARSPYTTNSLILRTTSTNRSCSSNEMVGTNLAFGSFDFEKLNTGDGVTGDEEEEEPDLADVVVVEVVVVLPALLLAASSLVVVEVDRLSLILLFLFELEPVVVVVAVVVVAAAASFDFRRVSRNFFKESKTLDAVDWLDFRFFSISVDNFANLSWYGSGIKDSTNDLIGLSTADSNSSNNDDSSANGPSCAVVVACALLLLVVLSLLVPPSLVSVLLLRRNIVGVVGSSVMVGR